MKKLITTILMISLFTFIFCLDGNAMNTKEGPACGSMLAEKTAGKIIIPAIIATKESIILILMADLTMFTSFPKYDAYVHKQPIHKERE